MGIGEGPCRGLCPDLLRGGTSAAHVRPMCNADPNSHCADRHAACDAGNWVALPGSSMKPLAPILGELRRFAATVRCVRRDQEGPGPSESFTGRSWCLPSSVCGRRTGLPPTEI